MNVFTWLKGGVAGDRLFYECRHCGTTLDAIAAGCPTCGRAEIATYEV